MGKGPHARKRRQQDRGSPPFLVAVSGHRDEACWLPRCQIVRSVHVALPRPRRPIAFAPVWFHQCPPGATTGGSRPSPSFAPPHRRVPPPSPSPPTPAPPPPPPH